LNLESLKGQDFTSFYKSGKFGKDLYEDLVAPKLESSLFVESWMHGKSGDLLPSDCMSSFKVYNIREVKPSSINFDSDNDHSKWAVSAESDRNNWICIGDINRQEPQEKRGGGTTCFQNKKIFNLYKDAVDKVEDCGGGAKRLHDEAIVTDSPYYFNLIE